MTSPEVIFTICRRTTASPYHILKSLMYCCVPVLFPRGEGGKGDLSYERLGMLVGTLNMLKETNHGVAKNSCSSCLSLDSIMSKLSTLQPCIIVF